MKVVLGLALMCCFIGGIVGCSCDGVRYCFCQDANPHVVKAKVAGVPAVFEKYREYPLIERNVFKGTDDFLFVRVPNRCGTLVVNGVYLFMVNPNWIPV